MLQYPLFTAAIDGRVDEVGLYKLKSVATRSLKSSWFQPVTRPAPLLLTTPASPAPAPVPVPAPVPAPAPVPVPSRPVNPSREKPVSSGIFFPMQLAPLRRGQRGVRGGCGGVRTVHCLAQPTRDARDEKKTRRGQKNRGGGGGGEAEAPEQLHEEQV
jgi:hypothetical protein